MFRPKLKTNYAYVRDEALPNFARGVIQQITANTYFTNGVTRAAPLNTGLELLNVAMAETAHPNPSQTAARDGFRADVHAALGDAAAQFNIDVKKLNLDVQQQEAALLSTGMALAEQPGSSRPTDEGVPTDVVLTDSTQAHCIDLGYKRPPGATQTITRYTTTPTLPEKNWEVKVGGARKQTLGPFEKGQEVFAKVAALWPTTTEPEYSAVFSRLVQ